MKFGVVALDDALGNILGHSVRGTAGTIKKGRVLARADLDALRGAGVTHVTVARLDADDVHEDDAATALGARLAGACVRVAAAFTGRANLFATADGIVQIDTTAIDRINAIDEAITIATLPPHGRVSASDMIATIKIIPYAVPRAALARVLEAMPVAALTVRPFAAKRAALILTTVPGSKDSVIAKRRDVTLTRLAERGATTVFERTVAHAEDAVCEAIRDAAAAKCDPILVFPASAISDRADVVPTGLIAAGGEIVRLGMPVDPGNLILVGRLGDADVIGVPSCAASPKLNGFDWVLDRCLADLSPASGVIAGMGVGGLLKEIATRPQPRAEPVPASDRRALRIGAIVLAAGRSTRMGAANKLVTPVAGKPIVRHTVERLLTSRTRPIVVVTGHMRVEVETALAGLDVRFVHNPEFATGLASSLRTGLAALEDAVPDGVLVALGDMPDVTAADIERLIAAFSPADQRAIVVPRFDGRRGNPVLWGRAFFAEMKTLDGDIGARTLIAANPEQVAEVDMDSDGVLTDIDTPDALAALKARRETT
jgi:molybdenum cofactor cytidylyltransferase